MSDAVTTISSYGKKPPFSSFLPGVAGEKGVPLWCFYVNRGQCVAGFGSRDKNHSIMEFSPAHTAYQRVQLSGFRTFLKVDGTVYEPFQNGEGCMEIHENMLSIHSECGPADIRVSYFIVPNADLGMLARRVEIRLEDDGIHQIEVLDGLASIVPFGLNQFDLKMMNQTAKAWMMVEGDENRLPYFRLRASLADTTSVEPIEEGSFGAAAVNGQLLPVVVDPRTLFGWDTAMTFPHAFANHALSDLLQKPQRKENELPCCFFAHHADLQPEQTICIESIYGLSHGLTSFHPHVEDLLVQGRLAEKQALAADLLSPYVRPIETHTADPLFDRYCRQSYIDNFLRGGVPHLYHDGEKKQLFYLFSRKHGDLERDYNDFVVTPEYASQGNGNFRDVLQNRRSDPRFCPDAGWAPLKPFLELIQSDGYNPLVIQPTTFVLDEPIDGLDIRQPFTPGDVMKQLEVSGLDEEAQHEMFQKVLCAARPQVNASFGEGYWVDHWIYLLDLLESWLSVYPESKMEMLNERCLRWFTARAAVQPLHKRCVKTPNGIRQHHALYEKQQNTDWLCTKDNQLILSTPLEKLFFLCVVKFAALDHTGEAISMEAGKPGWYDALNGLPGLFGSSTAESCELWRLLHFLLDALKSQTAPMYLPAEMAAFARKIACIASEPDPMKRWQNATSALEDYREQPISGMESILPKEALSMLCAMEKAVSESVSELIARTDGAFPTYFTNLPKEWNETEEGICPVSFDHRPLPLFLEGPMHVMRLPVDRETKKKIMESVSASGLYDEKLKMYKVCTDLSAETPELGRANAFTRGWLEHESVWLHMEYKYLLELIKNGFYDRFLEDFENALIPFQPEERYGRSVIENCSFLASSANPDPEIHGRGFVARLSGATAEFLDMWQRMFFGEPFAITDGSLRLWLCPTLPARLNHGEVCAMFLGHTPVTYHLPENEAVTPENHQPVCYRLLKHDGKEEIIQAHCLGEPYASAARSGQYSAIHVEIQRK